MIERKRFGKIGIFLVSLFFISPMIAAVALIPGLKGAGIVSFLPLGITLNRDLVVKEV